MQKDGRQSKGRCYCVLDWPRRRPLPCFLQVSQAADLFFGVGIVRDADAICISCFRPVFSCLVCTFPAFSVSTAYRLLAMVANFVLPK